MITKVYRSPNREAGSEEKGKRGGLDASSSSPHSHYYKKGRRIASTAAMNNAIRIAAVPSVIITSISADLLSYEISLPASLDTATCLWYNQPSSVPQKLKTVVAAGDHSDLLISNPQSCYIGIMLLDVATVEGEYLGQEDAPLTHSLRLHHLPRFICDPSHNYLTDRLWYFCVSVISPTDFSESFCASDYTSHHTIGLFNRQSDTFIFKAIGYTLNIHFPTRTPLCQFNSSLSDNLSLRQVSRGIRWSGCAQISRRSTTLHYHPTNEVVLLSKVFDVFLNVFKQTQTFTRKFGLAPLASQQMDKFSHVIFVTHFSAPSLRHHLSKFYSHSIGFVKRYFSFTCNTVKHYTTNATLWLVWIEN